MYEGCAITITHRILNFLDVMDNRIILEELGTAAVIF
jgi:hypothetical protein